MATVATRREEKNLVQRKTKEPTWLRPAFSWKAFTLRTLGWGSVSVMALYRQQVADRLDTPIAFIDLPATPA
jgi:hypothetical protein